MIQLSRSFSLSELQDDNIPHIKVIGVGGAGSNALDRIVLDGLEKADLVAANTDAQSLASSVASHKVQLGRMGTRGLGAGGDPELGYNAAVEAADEIRQGLGDARMVFVCAGLGGGTGSGAAPVIAELARESDAMVVSFATMPFAFEGKRRTAQALAALARLHEHSDAVICFENDKMGDMVAPKAGVHQAFAAADVTISQSVRAIVNLIQRPGLIHIGFDDLLSALRSTNGRCLFGFGESDTDNRAHDALTQALKNPLMDRGRLLSDASNLLVQVAGGPGMTLSEVEILMQELERHVSDETQILFGTAVDNRMGNRLAVTLISSLPAEGEVVQPVVHQKVAPTPKPVAPPILQTQPEAAAQVEEEEEEMPLAEEFAAPVSLQQPMPMSEAASQEPEFFSEATTQEQEVEEEDVEVNEPEMESTTMAMTPVATREPDPVPPRVILPRTKSLPVIAPKVPVEKIVHAKQEVLQFESVTRGRFEKSEPTIVEGQDLDVPTFLRKNVRVK
ncbi:MAG: cell division protein FtsZ [Chthoniobacterales bacterium]